MRRGWATSRAARAALWLALFAVACAADGPVSRAVHDRAPLRPWERPREHADRGSVAQAQPRMQRSGPAVTVLKRVLRAPGHFAFTLGLAAVLAVRHPLRWRAAGLLLAGGAIAGVAAWLLKWAVGRTRPFRGVPPFEFHPFAAGLAGLVSNHNRAFPSGDAALAFATAACMAALLPRWRPVLFVVAAVVGMERVLENAHHVSDVVGGAAVGVLCVPLTQAILRLLSESTPQDLSRRSYRPGGGRGTVVGGGTVGAP